MALDGVSALVLAALALEVSAEIKITFLHCLLPPCSPISFHTMPFKIRFATTWQTHYIVFQIRKGNKLTGKKFRLFFVWKPIQKMNCLILLLLAIKFQNTFKILHYGAKFLL